MKTNVTMVVSARIAELKQPQITVSGLPETIRPTKKARATLEFELNGEKSSLVMGDTHAVWKTHQATEAQKQLFDKLYAKLSANPGQQAALEVEVKEASVAAQAAQSLDNLIG